MEACDHTQGLFTQTYVSEFPGSELVIDCHSEIEAWLRGCSDAASVQEFRTICFTPVALGHRDVMACISVTHI